LNMRFGGADPSDIFPFWFGIPPDTGLMCCLLPIKCHVKQYSTFAQWMSLARQNECFLLWLCLTVSFHELCLLLFQWGRNGKNKDETEVFTISSYCSFLFLTFLA
jgi:hypothetical protein